MTLRAVLAENLKLLRKRRGLSQEELASAAGIDRTYVSSLERARYSASIDTLERIANALGIPAHELLREMEED